MSGAVRSGFRGPGGRSEPVAASQGWGPLVQRDYWAVLRQPKGRPSQLIAVVKERFPDFPPQDLVRFRRADGRAAPLRVGDDLEVRINPWTDFIDRLAAMLAQGIDGAIHAESRFVPEEPEDRTPPGAPTFVAEAE